MNQIPTLNLKRNLGIIEKLLLRDAFNLRLLAADSIIPENAEVEYLWDVIDTFGIAVAQNKDEKSINFKEFFMIKQKLEQSRITKFSRFFKASIFLHFPADLTCRISSVQFYNFVMRKVSLEQARVDLANYDLDHDGFLTEQDLTTFICDMMPLMQLPNITPAFRKFYVCTAVRKFLFFLDKMHIGKIAIQNILLSPILTELFELRECELDGSEKSNWFSSHSTLRVYGKFQNLDQNHNGLLSRTEMSAYNNAALTDIVLDRLFDEVTTYRNEHGENEMDYPGFIDLVLAMENNTTPEAVNYFWRLLDMHHVGYLDQFTIQIFVKQVVKKMILLGYEDIGEEDIINEIFDMSNPSDTRRITLTELIKSGVGGTVVSILCDVRGFHAFENRECIVSDEDAI